MPNRLTSSAVARTAATSCINWRAGASLPSYIVVQLARFFAIIIIIILYIIYRSGAAHTVYF